MCVVVGCFNMAHPMRQFVVHAVVRSGKVVLVRRVGWLRPGLFVQWGVGGYGRLANLSVQLNSHSESSCWLYNFTTFTCAHPTRDLHRFTPLKVAETLVATSAMLLHYIYALHFQALWSDDSENYINSSSFYINTHSNVAAYSWLLSSCTLLFVSVCVCVCAVSYTHLTLPTRSTV